MIELSSHHFTEQPRRWDIEESRDLGVHQISISPSHHIVSRKYACCTVYSRCLAALYAVGVSMQDMIDQHGAHCALFADLGQNSRIMLQRDVMDETGGSFDLLLKGVNAI